MNLRIKHTERNVILAALATEAEAANDTLDAILKANAFVTTESVAHYHKRIADCNAIVKLILEQTREYDK